MATVTMKFVGAVADRAKVNEITIDVNNDPDIAAQEVYEAIVEKIGKNTLFTILLNDLSFSMVKKNLKEIKDGDCFSIVPVIMGG